MKTAFIISTLAVVFMAASPCLGLWQIASISKDDAKKMGLEVRSAPAGPDFVRVELELKLDGKFKDFTGVELRTNQDDKHAQPNLLPEDRTKEGRVVVSVTVDRAHLDNFSLGVRVPELDGGTIYQLRLKDFVELKKEK